MVRLSSQHEYELLCPLSWACFFEKIENQPFATLKYKHITHMRILTNEYLSNVPGANIIAHGGPAHFANKMKGFLVAHGHEWIGVVPAYQEHITTHIIVHDGGVKLFEINATTATLENLRLLAENVSPEIYFREIILSLKTLMRDVFPDVVFLNGYSVFNGLIDIAARSLEIPVVIQHAGIMKKEVDQYRELFTEAGAGLCCEMEKKTALCAAVNIFLNTSSEQAFCEAYDIAEVPNTVIVPLPYAQNSFRYIPKTLPKDGTLTFGVVARWDRIKNHQALLLFAEEVKRAGLSWKIKVVTKIPETLKQVEMKEQYRALIEVVPPMHNKDLQSFYRSIDIALLPSHFDASPTVVMEALAFGVPTLIGPGVGWASEYQHCGMKDWVTSFDDPCAVVDLLQTKLFNSVALDCTSLASYIEVHHKPETVFGAYHDIFTKILLV